MKFRIRVALVLPSLLLAACASPKTKYLRLQEIPETEVASTPAAALKRSPPAQAIVRKADGPRLSIDFDDKSPVVLIDESNFPYQTARIKHLGAATPYLVFSGSYHNVGFGKVGAVQPSVYLFDQKLRPVKEVTVAQIGEDIWDGVLKKLKTTYSLKKVPPGDYSVVIVAESKDPTTPLGATQTPMVMAASTIIMPMKIDVYADFFGGCEAYLSPELPLKRDRVGVATFEK
jgi:hypothetical protein